MPDSDDALRFLFAKAFESSSPTDDCPSAEALFDAVHGRVGAEERAAIAEHLAGCPVCAEAWRLARLTIEPASGNSRA